MCRLCLDTVESKLILEDERDERILATIEIQTNLKACMRMCLIFHKK